MKKMGHAAYGLLLLLLLSSSVSWGQDTDQPKKMNYKKNPHWIQMMDDPNVNYHEAVKAFDEFWKDRGEPEKESGEGESHEEKRSLLKRIFKSEEKEQAENMQYAVAYKRFKQWKRDVEPFVQSDGSILSAEEQMKIWEDARK